MGVDDYGRGARVGEESGKDMHEAGPDEDEDDISARKRMAELHC